jgi:hypothetical protein
MFASATEVVLCLVPTPLDEGQNTRKMEKPNAFYAIYHRLLELLDFDSFDRDGNSQCSVVKTLVNKGFVERMDGYCQ